MTGLLATQGISPPDKSVPAPFCACWRALAIVFVVCAEAVCKDL